LIVLFLLKQKNIDFLVLHKLKLKQNPHKMSDKDVAVIQKTHKDLREKLAKEKDMSLVWKSHLENADVLKQYAEAMKNMAQNKWDKGSTGQSRIKWCEDICDSFFNGGGLQKQLDKDERRRGYYEKDPSSFVCGPNPYVQTDLTSIKQVSNVETTTDSESDLEPPKAKRSRVTLKLLDVGSCYNPFKDCFDTLAIDLQPATKDVYKADFLNVKLVKSNEFILPKVGQEEGEHQVLANLPTDHFDVVAFCLLLTYVPCPTARWLMCSRAHKVLKTNGLFLLVTPDSNCVNKRAKLTKQWKEAITSIGFQRVHYSKTAHLHHFAFRKVSCAHLWDRRSIVSKPPGDVDSHLEKLHIPQDFTIGKTDKVEQKKVAAKK